MADKSVASRVHALQQKIASAEAERADWAESVSSLVKHNASLLTAVARGT